MADAKLEQVRRTEPSDPIADLLAAVEPRPDALPVFSPAALVNLERVLGAETVFEGPTPAAVVAERARRR